MDKKFVALLLLLAMLLVAPICLAQWDHDREQVWLPPSWVFGSGYTPYDYPGSVGGWGYDSFSYYSHQGKTYNPYRDSNYYYPGSTWYPSYYRYNYNYPYTYRNYWYPYTYHSGYWWS